MPIIQSISRFLQTVQTPFVTLSNIYHQKKFIRKHISPMLTAAEKSADGSLDERDIEKITGYYGLAVPAVLGEAFCALRGERMTTKERMASTNQGAMTGLGDDFFDRQRLSDQGVKDFIENPEQFTGNTASEKLFLNFYKQALINAPDAGKVKEQILRVFQAQLLSKQQDGDSATYEMLKDITMRKGGESLLYYRTAFEHPMQKGEEKMLYCLGGLMQLSNDIFDIYKDRQSGVSTLATTTKHIAELRTYYAALLKLGTLAAYRSGYPKNNVSRFLNLLNLGIFSRCFVCLDQLAKNEKKTNAVFMLRSYSRKQLVCDMDKFGNQLKSVGYLLKQTKQVVS